MQTHNLMPQHIRPSLQPTRNRHRPRIITRNQIVRPPSPRRRTAFQADLVDFSEFEGGFVGGGAVVVGAGGEVVEDGAFVAGGPGVPEELHGLAGGDGDVGFSWSAGFVADYVGGLVAVGGDLGGFVSGLVGWFGGDGWIDGWIEGFEMETYEAGVKGCGAPACDCGRVRLVVVVEVPARVEFAAGLDEVDEAVGRGFGDELD